MMLLLIGIFSLCISAQTEGVGAQKPRAVRAAARVPGNPKIETIARSREGRAVRAYIFNPQGTIRVLVIGGTHGDEPASAALARRFIESLREDSLGSSVRVVVVPVLNPDGLALGTRTNARQIDINRNLPTRDWGTRARASRYSPGARAASEPETRALLRLLRRRPRLIISIHAPLRCVNWDGDAERIAQTIADVNGYKLCPSIGYPTPGSLGTYAGVERAIPTVTLELGRARAGELVDAPLTAMCGW